MNRNLGVVVLVITLLFALAAAGCGDDDETAAPTSTPDASSTSCGKSGASSSDDRLAHLQDAFSQLDDALGDLYSAIEANDDFTSGWTERGDVGAASDDLEAEVQVLVDAAAAILEYEGWTLDGPEWTVPADDLPVPPDLSAVEEIWRSPDAFASAMANLDAESSQQEAMDFWVTGGSPCGTAGTISDTLLPAALGAE